MQALRGCTYECEYGRSDCVVSAIDRIDFGKVIVSREAYKRWAAVLLAERSPQLKRLALERHGIELGRRHHERQRRLQQSGQ
jgi:hypothetical protein